MRQRSKRYRALAEKIGDPKQPRPIAEAVDLVKKCANGKFTESVDLVVHLNLDAKKADQAVRGSFSLPHGTGKQVRVIVFADEGDAIQGALAAGAVKAGGDDLVTAVQEGFMDFDVAIATPKMMRVVGKLGRVLGPRGLMPAPKSGTVTEDVVTATREFKGGKIEYRADAAGNVHVRIGNIGFQPQQLAENAEAFYHYIADHRPSSVKGEYVKSVHISSTMGPGIRVAVAAQGGN